MNNYLKVTELGLTDGEISHILKCPFSRSSMVPLADHTALPWYPLYITPIRNLLPGCVAFHSEYIRTNDSPHHKNIAERLGTYMFPLAIVYFPDFPFYTQYAAALNYLSQTLLSQYYLLTLNKEGNGRMEVKPSPSLAMRQIVDANNKGDPFAIFAAV